MLSAPTRANGVRNIAKPILSAIGIFKKVLCLAAAVFLAPIAGLMWGREPKLTGTDARCSSAQAGRPEGRETKQGGEAEQDRALE
jgi:hypothetical protein